MTPINYQKKIDTTSCATNAASPSIALNMRNEPIS